MLLQAWPASLWKVWGQTFEKPGAGGSAWSSGGILVETGTRVCTKNGRAIGERNGSTIDVAPANSLGQELAFTALPDGG